MRKRRISPILALLLVAVLPALAEVPDRIESPTASQGAPIWVSADVAVANGKIRWELFDSVQEMLLRPALEQARAATRSAGKEVAASVSGDTGCTAWNVSVGEPILDDYSLPNLYDHVDLAFTARVTDERQGFWYGQGATLYELAVDHVLKEPAAAPDLDRVYLVHSYAAIKVGHDTICERDQRYPARASAGRRILVFTSTIVSRQPTVVTAADDGLLYELSDGSLSLPARFGEIIDAPTWESVVGDVIALAEDKGRNRRPPIKQRQER